VGAFLKLHHVVADGPAGVAAFGALLDKSGRYKKEHRNHKIEEKILGEKNRTKKQKL
jgi:hypothetical protein